MTIGELKFIVRIDKGLSTTDIITVNEKESPLPLKNWKKKTLMGCVAPTNNFVRFFV